MECFVDYIGVGDRVRQVRKSRKWTQAQLAEAVGCSTANITNIERAKTKLSLNMILAISKALEVGVETLTGTGRTAGQSPPSAAELGLREIWAELSPENARLCQEACVEFCTAFSRHLKQI